MVGLHIYRVNTVPLILQTRTNIVSANRDDYFKTLSRTLNPLISGDRTKKL